MRTAMTLMVTPLTLTPRMVTTTTPMRPHRTTIIMGLRPTTRRMNPLR